MSHLVESINGQIPTLQGQVTALDALDVIGEANDGDVVGVNSLNELSAVKLPQRSRAYVAGGTTWGASTVDLFVPITNSAYPYFLEVGPLFIATTARLGFSSDSGLTWLYNTYTGGATTYVNGLQISNSGLYRLSADWCVGSLSTSGAYVDVQWQTSTGEQLGPIVRIGRSDEKRNTCVGYVNVTTSAIVGLYVHAISNAKYNLDNFNDILIYAEKV
jgi:hypothetical protein